MAAKIGMRAILLIMLALAVLACDRLPRDPEDTLSHARQGPLRVGIIESPPWTRYDAQDVSGVEVELVERLATELGCDIQWIRGSEASLMPAPERFELHLVVGGLTSNTPWSKRVGLSRSYFTNRFMVGVPPGQRLETISNQIVAVAEDSPLVAVMARERDAEVVRVPRLVMSNMPVLAPAWQLELLNFELTGIEVHSEKHVMAAPPGENGWLMWLDRFLERKADETVTRLRRQESRP